MGEPSSVPPVNYIVERELISTGAHGSGLPAVALPCNIRDGSFAWRTSTARLTVEHESSGGGGWLLEGNNSLVALVHLDIVD